MKNKYCFKADGTQLTSSKIATALGLLGEINVGSFTFDSAINCYYFLQDNDLISHSESIPTGYELVNVDEFLARYKPNPFPKKMWVSDFSKHDARSNKKERLVIAYHESLARPWVAISVPNAEHIVQWQFAIDIEEEPVVELTLDEIAKKFDISVEKLKIKK